MNSVCLTVLGSRFGFLIRSSSILAALRPISSQGWAITVNCGSKLSAGFKSGTRNTRSRRNAPSVSGIGFRSKRRLRGLATPDFTPRLAAQNRCPPKAKVTRSNHVGCASKIRGFLNFSLPTEPHRKHTGSTVAPQESSSSRPSRHRLV